MSDLRPVHHPPASSSLQYCRSEKAKVGALDADEADERRVLAIQARRVRMTAQQRAALHRMITASSYTDIFARRVMGEATNLSELEKAQGWRVIRVQNGIGIKVKVR